MRRPTIDLLYSNSTIQLNLSEMDNIDYKYN